jgi:branched-chain amino acid transport system ATP-binding protein
MTMLEVKNLSVTYGFHRALEGINLSIEKGEICVILGTNGAGKSSLLKAIAGMEKPDQGSEIVMNGQPITRLKAHKIVEAGIALVPEGRGIFGDLSVAENLQLGAFAARARGDESKTLRRIYELFPRLAERKKQIARTMSGGEQQMVAIGRALMSRPDILMLDEPSLGLSPILTIELFRSLAGVAESGVGILLVEQNAKQSLKIAERGYLIENGHVVGEGSAKALANDPAVISAYLGGGTSVSARPKINLPPAFRLPGNAAAISQSIGALGSRAGDIQRAYVRAMRRGSALPSAFVGRYDPKSGSDPWEEISMTPAQTPPPRTPTVGADARLLAGNTAAMVKRATDRLAVHIRTARLSGGVPSAFAEAKNYQATVPPAATPSVPNSPGTPPGLQSPAELARKASERMSAHIARIRASNALPSAFAEAQLRRQTAAHAPQPSEPANRHGQIGHNSAAFGVADDPEPAPVKDSATGLSIADIVARAAAIHSAHIARQRRSNSGFPSAEERQRLTAFKMPALKPAPYETQNDPAPNGQDTNKET